MSDDIKVKVATLETRCSEHRRHQEKVEVFMEATSATLAKLNFAAWILAALMSSAIGLSTWAVKTIVRDTIIEEARAGRLFIPQAQARSNQP